MRGKIRERRGEGMHAAIGNAVHCHFTESVAASLHPYLVQFTHDHLFGRQSSPLQLMRMTRRREQAKEMETGDKEEQSVAASEQMTWLGVSQSVGDDG